MYQAHPRRYDTMQYRRVGKSGIKLPSVSLGLWHNFGGVTLFENSREMVLGAFDLGITHFDLANNYGPPPGSAEENFGRILRNELSSYRDELIISTKSGYHMWEGPYGEWGSRKNLIASCDQSLQRLGVDYVDIFYHHRPDPDTPLEETMGALADIVKSGKALYVAISNYPLERAKEAMRILKELRTPCLLHQIRFNIFARNYETDGMFDFLEEEGVGSILFSPLAQGLLSSKYLQGVPKDSRATRNHFLKESQITPELLSKIEKLNEIAKRRSQSLAQMALVWTLQFKSVSSALIGASRVEQIKELCEALQNKKFTQEELKEIDEISLS